MKALCWQGKKDIRCETVPDPVIEDAKDAIVEVSACAICGSDLHLMDGFVPTMCKGDVLGHETMGRVVEVGPEARARGLGVGERVVLPFQITCGECEKCRAGQFSVCETTNRNKDLATAFFGGPTAGIYGYSHITGGYAGGQAQYIRVPYAATSTIKVPDGPADEALLFLSDIFPTGWQAADQAEIQPTDVVAVWGCGPVGLFAIKSAFLQGATRVIAIDYVPERLHLAEQAGAETINYRKENVLLTLKEMTAGKGPDKCIECVGMESDVWSGGVDNLIDQALLGLKLTTERGHSLREAILCCRPGGTVSIAGVFGGLMNNVPMGAVMNKGLTLRTGQTHVKRYADHLLALILDGKIDPTFLITDVEPLSRGPEMYAKFRGKKDGCIKVVLKPN